jgi:DNA polymerase III subunit gamma/tau
MSAYTVLATRYRPRRFEDVVGQEDAAAVLRSAVDGSRSAHAYLFSGPRGVGKTSMARILAKAWNCLAGEGGLPCGTCAVCRSIDESGDSLDVVEIDGASHNRVENVRDLIEKLRFRPVEARYRVTIVDEVHMLSTSAFNALLKTLEEPPSHARFILATTEPLKVPETIRSRCQQIDFRRLEAETIAARLAEICVREQVPVPEGLLQRVARQARGGLRDALSLLDQLITFGQGAPSLADFERLTGRLPPELLAELLRSTLAGDAGAALTRTAEALGRGARPADLIDQLTELSQGLLVTAAGGQPADRTAEERAVLAGLASGSDIDQLMAMLDVLVEASRRLRQRADGRLVAEMAVVNLARLPRLASLSELLASVPAGPSSGALASGAAVGTVKPASPPVARTATPRTTPPAEVSGRAGGGPASAPARAPASGPAAVTSSAAAVTPAGQDDFAVRFVAEAGQGSRSLRAELQRYPSIRIEGDELVVQPPTPVVFDPLEPELRGKLEAAATKLAGRALRLRVAAAPGQSGRPARAPKGDLEQRIRADWPGAERIDS